MHGAISMNANHPGRYHLGMRRPSILPALVWLLVSVLAAGEPPRRPEAARPAYAAGDSVELQGPLTTVIPLRLPARTADGLPTEVADAGRIGEVTLVADLDVPADAPADLGVGAFVIDQHGTWFQALHPDPLRPGRNRLVFALGRGEALVQEPGRGAWGPREAGLSRGTGLFLWSAGASRTRIRVLEFAVKPLEKPDGASGGALADLVLPGFDAQVGTCAVVAGERWELAVRPDPFPVNPYDPDEFSLDAEITRPDGTQVRLPGFHALPMVNRDRGDAEMVEPNGAGTFRVRFRPSQPGSHGVRLIARWGGGKPTTTVLPALVVEGKPWNGWVRVDREDPRFLSVDGRFHWPIGLNIRSVNDARGRDKLGSKLTPDRGSLSYAAYLARLAAGGGDTAEIWMSSWNLALEWRADWPGYQGRGFVNEANAWRLDRILDAAWRDGVRINLVIDNHGKGSSGTDREWQHNPWNRALGGPINQASGLFSDPAALAGQDRLRRYIAGRWADHPAVLAWKLWSEVKLTDGGKGGLSADWHAQAAKRWAELDAYGHPVTTHWQGDYRVVEPATAQLPGLTMLCIDAYISRKNKSPGVQITDLIADSIHDPARGLAQYGKPVLVTEYGGSSSGCPEPQMIAAHASAPWAALVSGHAGSPMLWWFEWVDQGQRWAPFAAIRAFLIGEDLRHAKGRSVLVAATASGTTLWSRAWVRPGRILGYCCDSDWTNDGLAGEPLSGIRIVLGEQVKPGAMSVEWWDADRGVLKHTESLAHAGGPLVLTPPAFRRHIGFKVIRK